MYRSSMSCVQNGPGGRPLRAQTWRVRTAAGARRIPFPDPDEIDVKMSSSNGAAERLPTRSGLPRFVTFPIHTPTVYVDE